MQLYRSRQKLDAETLRKDYSELCELSAYVLY